MTTTTGTGDATGRDAADSGDDPRRDGPGSPAAGTRVGGAVEGGAAEGGAVEGGAADAHPVGPLDPAAVRRVVTADVLTVATAGRDGTRDVTVLAGRRCFVRVLDAGRLAWPVEGTEPTSAYRANLVEDPRVALLLLGSGGDGRRRGLHLNGTARVVPAEHLRREHPDLPVEPVPGRAADVWAVVEVGDAHPLDDADTPPIVPIAGRAPAPPAPEPAYRGLLLPALIALVTVLALITAVAAIVLDGRGTPATVAAPAPPPAPLADPGPIGPPTLYGRVTAVRDPATVVVDVAGRPLTVGVVGLDAAAVPPCATGDALDFARTTLQDRTVTLVPDPTLPAGGPLRAYVVLDTQLSYTDAAILAGWSPAVGPAQYRPVFDREQRSAQSARVGMWGPPCTRRG